MEKKANHLTVRSGEIWKKACVRKWLHTINFSPNNVIWMIQGEGFAQDVFRLKFLHRKEELKTTNSNLKFFVMSSYYSQLSKWLCSAAKFAFINWEILVEGFLNFLSGIVCKISFILKSRSYECSIGGTGGGVKTITSKRRCWGAIWYDCVPYGGRGHVGYFCDLKLRSSMMHQEGSKERAEGLTALLHWSQPYWFLCTMSYS